MLNTMTKNIPHITRVVRAVDELAFAAKRTAVANARLSDVSSSLPRDEQTWGVHHIQRYEAAHAECEDAAQAERVVFQTASTALANALNACGASPVEQGIASRALSDLHQQIAQKELLAHSPKGYAPWSKGRKLMQARVLTDAEMSDARAEARAEADDGIHRALGTLLATLALC